jgi:uncharacterized protein
LALSGIFYIFIAKYKIIMRKIVGREEEIKVLQKTLQSNKSEFIAVYGRRRVGKTFLIRSAFEDNFTFYITGSANVSLSRQLSNFYNILQKKDNKTTYLQTNNWFQAFEDLGNFIEKSVEEKKVIFIDELPWFDTQKSGFIQALEHFWNSWASLRDDIILVVCGSAASWMINKLINNRGGLHNRTTKRLKIVPFKLKECELFLADKNIVLDRYQIIQLYMAFGGIPFYWDDVVAGKSAMQNIEQICFTRNGLLRDEFNNLYRSLFRDYEKHLNIVEALSQKSKGLTREEIIKIAKLNNGGSVTRLLRELEESGFVRKYNPFGKKSREATYQLVDNFTNFYLKFMKDSEIEGFSWIAMLDSPQYRTWCGYAFEQICLYHLAEIKKALGVSGVITTTSAWRSNKSETGVQIDLVIDRRDNVINICEIKYSINDFEIDKNYNQNLRNKIGIFKEETKTRKAVFLTMITTFGLKNNAHSLGIIQNSITMDELFKHT